MRKHFMGRLVASCVLAVVAMVPTFSWSPSASAHHVIDQGCVHYREKKGPTTQAWTVDAFLRCEGRVVWRKPDIIGGLDGECKKMIPHHRVEWFGFGHTQPLPWQHAVRGMKPCGPDA